MASYIITGPDGKRYKVSGQGSKEEALAHIQQRVGQQDRSRPYTEVGQIPAGNKPPDPLDELKNAANVGSDVMRVGVDAAGLGSADYMAGGNQKQLTDEARARLGPVGGTLTDIGGGMLTPMGQVKNAGRVGKALYNAGEGGVTNTINEWTHGNRDPMSLGGAFLTGSGISGLASGAGDLWGSWRARRNAEKAIPTDEQIVQEGKDLRKKTKEGGAYYRGDDRRKLEAELTNMRFRRGLDDRAIGVRNHALESLRAGTLTPDQFDMIRQDIRRQSKTTTPWDRTGGEKMIAGMDKWAKGTKVRSRTGADLSGLNDALLGARNKEMIAKQVEEIREAAPKRRGWANIRGEGSSGPSVNRFEKMAQKNKERGGRGYSPEAQQKIEELARGSKLGDIGEVARRLSPFRNLMTGVGTGIVASSGGMGLPLAAVIGGTEVMSKVGRNATRNEVEELLALTKTGKGLQIDPEKANKARQLLARISASGTRAGYNANRGE